MDNLHQSTTQAREVLRQAQSEAARLHHAEVTPEHLTIALTAYLQINTDCGLCRGVRPYARAASSQRCVRYGFFRDSHERPHARLVARHPAPEVSDPALLCFFYQRATYVPCQHNILTNAEHLCYNNIWITLQITL